jgi:hypothetical protein
VFAVAAKVARSLRLSTGCKPVVVGTGRAARGGTLAVKLTANARKRLRRLRQVNLALTVRAGDAAGNRTTVTRTARLTSKAASLTR